MRYWLSALVVAAAAAAMADPFEIFLDSSLDPDIRVTDAVVGEINEFGAFAIINSFGFEGDQQPLIDSNASPLPDSLGVVGRYTLNGNDEGVMVLLNRAVAVELAGLTWDDLFPSHPEMDIEQALLDIQDDGNPVGQQNAVNLLFDFFTGNMSYFPSQDSEAAWVGFSDPVIYGSGTWTANPVPEPGLLIAAAAGAALLRRRRKA